MKEYWFTFATGWKDTGRPIILTRAFKGDTMRDAELLLHHEHPQAFLVGLARERDIPLSYPPHQRSEEY